MIRLRRPDFRRLQPVFAFVRLSARDHYLDLSWPLIEIEDDLLQKKRFSNHSKTRSEFYLDSIQWKKFIYIIKSIFCVFKQVMGPEIAFFVTFESSGGKIRLLIKILITKGFTVQNLVEIKCTSVNC